MSEVTNDAIFQAIKELSVQVRETRQDIQKNEHAINRSGRKINKR